MVIGAMTITLPALAIGSRLMQLYEANMQLVLVDDFSLDNDYAPSDTGKGKFSFSNSIRRK